MKFVILEPEVNLVMEYVPHGSLKCYLKINKDRLDTKKHILKYALDVAKVIKLYKKHGFTFKLYCTNFKYTYYPLNILSNYPLF